MTPPAIRTQGNIEALSVQQLDKLCADMWLLAPPCQPYTRQGLKKESQDNRAASFLVLLQKLQKLCNPPRSAVKERVQVLAPGVQCLT